MSQGLASDLEAGHYPARVRLSPCLPRACLSCLFALACREESHFGVADSRAEGGVSPGVGASGEGGAANAVVIAAGAASLEGEGGAAPCRNNPAVIEYEPDLTVASPNGMTVRLERSAPLPGVGNHTWFFQVSSPGGVPVVGADIRVTPFMPEHRHGSPLTAVVAEQGEGAYEAYPVEFTMTGYWRTTIRVVTTGWTDAAVVPLCIE